MKKNLLRLLLVVVILLLLFLQSLPMCADTVKGDANNSGAVNVADIVAVTNHIHGNTPEEFNATAADVNESGSITVADIVGIINIIHYSSYESSGIVSLGASINDWVEGNGGGEELTQSQEYGD